MKFSTRSRYAIMAVVDMASNFHGDAVSLQSIAIRQNIPLNYLEQIFSKLRREGIIKSVRGPGGGYIPNKPMESILLSEVLLAVDSSFKMTRCSSGVKCNPMGGRCSTHSLWKGLGSTMFNYFNSISVADVVKNKVEVQGSI